jgi:hypothetical protein
LKLFPSSSIHAVKGSFLECDVVAFGSVRLTPQELVHLRQDVGPPAGIKLSSGFLKHAEEQSIAALAAVFQAIKQNGMEADSFTNWLVIGAPRFVGRSGVSIALEKFKAEGAWGVSPHLIPHRSLHSISGAISQALKIHGPNFGVGGGRSAADEALLLAVSLVDPKSTPGVWVVMTGWNPEPDLTKAMTEQDAVCNGLALALRPIRSDFTGWRLSVIPHRTVGYATEVHPSHERDLPIHLEQLQEVLGTKIEGKFTAVWPLLSKGYLTLERVVPSHANNGLSWSQNGAATMGAVKKIGTGLEAKS